MVKGYISVDVNSTFLSWARASEGFIFVGRATENKLSNLGIRTIGEIATFGPYILKSNMYKHNVSTVRYTAVQA